uniref:Transposase Tc1-like domain-containing protein n=1 Tax=Astyanax mexicanus TaxID=7994 RepID=A0A3B1JCF4_ASTMX
MEGHKAGKGYKTLSKDLGNTSTVGGIIRKWKAYGTTVNLLWSKQPFKISSCVEVRLVRIAKADPKTTRREIREDLMEMGTLVSVNIISNVLHRNVKARLQFAHDHLEDSEADWFKVLWSDQNKIDVFDANHNRNVWSQDGTAY